MTTVYLTEHAVLRYRERIAPDLSYLEAFAEPEQRLGTVALETLDGRVDLGDFRAVVVRVGDNQIVVKTVVGPKRLPDQHKCHYCGKLYQVKPHQRSLHKRWFCRPLCEKRHRDEAVRAKRPLKRPAE